MFQRLLLCTDFSDGLQRLVHFVPSLAAGGTKQLVFLHSVPFVEGQSISRVDTVACEEARKQLEVALQSVPQGVDVQVEIRSGRPTDAILEVAKQYAVDLVVLGTPTRSLLSEKLFGSTTVDILQQVTTPLMVLRPQLIATYTSEELDLRCRHLFRCLLVPYHGSDASKYLVQQLRQTMQAHPDASSTQLHLCWVVDGVRRRDVPADYYIETAKQALAAIAADFKASGVTVDPVEVREGDPLTEVLKAAQCADVSAIATASSHTNKLLEWTVPQFTNELLRRSWHPIIYFPPDR